MATRAATDFQNSYLQYSSPVYNPSFDTDPVSAAIWVYWSDSGVIQASHGGAGGTGTNVAIMFEEGNVIKSNIGGVVAGSTSLTATSWYHWSMSFPGGTGTVRLYLDGVQDGSNSKTGASRDGLLIIGANAVGSNDINDVVAYAQYYDVELTAAHMQEIQYQPFAHAGDLCWMPDMLENGTYRDLSKDQNGNPTVQISGSISASLEGPPVFLLGGQ